jgi:two-component system response regulator FlrC
MGQVPPPLSERREDVLPMAEVMLAKICEPRPPMKLSQDARDALRNANLPGNARELRNILERAVILADGPVLHAADLNLQPAVSEPTSVERLAAGAPRETLEQLERAAIERALREAGGNRRRAAESLGIALRTFYDKVARHGLG